MDDKENVRGYEGRTEVSRRRIDRTDDNERGYDDLLYDDEERDGYDADGFNAMSRWLLDNCAKWGK